ncbi:hypothetical protein L596_022557 [Steinernema carpocapsae]|uniref:Uncharacterized protein n=1 Tax=Steinernema carpocapsae TaxID=34508 RepID=A0A4U5MMW8_STECR|nr:hypothetical protein L596_022557 [Steinernema carpocapsae]
MIVAGGVFDKAIGLYMGISIMAAAGVGNIVSNIMGLGMFHYVETAVSYFGIKPPRLNAKQMNNKSVRVFTNLARYLGLFVGCFLGMTPLLFIDSPERSIPVDYNAADDEDQEMEMREIATTTSTMRYDLDDIGKRKDEEMARKRSEFMRAEYARFHAEWKRLTSKEDAEDIGMFMHLSDMSDDSS